MAEDDENQDQQDSSAEAQAEDSTDTITTVVGTSTTPNPDGPKGISRTALGDNSPALYLCLGVIGVLLIVSLVASYLLVQGRKSTTAGQLKTKGKKKKKVTQSITSSSTTTTSSSGTNLGKVAFGKQVDDSLAYQVSKKPDTFSTNLTSTSCSKFRPPNRRTGHLNRGGLDTDKLSLLDNHQGIKAFAYKDKRRFSIQGGGGGGTRPAGRQSWWVYQAPKGTKDTGGWAKINSNSSNLVGSKYTSLLSNVQKVQTTTTSTTAIKKKMKMMATSGGGGLAVKKYISKKKKIQQAATLSQF